MYKILNTIDNGVYVGSTVESLCKIMYKHRHDSCRMTFNVELVNGDLDAVVDKLGEVQKMSGM